MTALGIQLAWLAVRVTVVAAAALGLVAWCGRRGARSTVAVLGATMLILLTLALASLGPLPDAWRWTIHERLPKASAAPSSLERSTPAAPVGEAVSEQTSSFANLIAWLEKGGGAPTRGSTTSPWGWQLFAGVYLLCVAVGVVRLVLGWRELAALRRRSRAITDPELIERAQALSARLRVGPHVDLYEVDDFGPAATLGWRRPAILLAADWRGWSEDERRAVLAHELAHVRHRDFLLGFVAGLCRVVHFYHPLVRWLAAQMRWRQEVAADDLAATVAGGRPAYLKALARLALKLPARMPAGAHLTLPAMTGGIFLRRIDMLRKAEQRPMRRVTRCLITGFLAALAVLVVTWRGPAQTPASGTPAVQVEPFELGYLAPEARGIVAVRPSVWMAQPGMDRFAKKMAEILDQAIPAGIKVPEAIRPENIEQIVANLHIGTTGTGKPGSRSVQFGASSLLIRFHKDVDAAALVRPLLPDMKEVRKGNVVICRLGTFPVLGPVPVTILQPDRRTVILVADKSDDAAEAMLARAAVARKRDWGSGWKQVERAACAVVLDNNDGGFAKIHAHDLAEAPDLKFIEDVRFATVGIELGDGRPVRMILDAKSAETAKGVEASLTRLFRDGLDKAKQEAPNPDAAEKVWLKLATELLELRQVRIDDSRVQWVVYSSVRVGDLIGDDGLPLGTE